VNHALADIGSLTLSDEEFRAIAALVYERLGIQLTEQKRALIMGRLQSHVRKLGLNTYSEYCRFVASDPTGASLDELANRISTNHTFFFRESAHFKVLAETVLPALTAQLRKVGERDLRVWCAACSSGEEAYTLAMLLLEHLGTERAQWQAGVLATDISAKVLNLATQGVYSDERLTELPPALRHRYFHKVGDGMSAVTPQLKAEVVFRRLNLMREAFPFRKRFHVVFCRNVMIYFDQQTRDALVRRIAQVTEPGGHFFIGHSESLGRDNGVFRYVAPAHYVREGT